MFQMPDVIKMRGIKTNWIDKVNVPLIAFFLFSALATLKPQAGMAVVPSAAPVQVRPDCSLVYTVAHLKTERKNLSNQSDISR